MRPFPLSIHDIWHLFCYPLLIFGQTKRCVQTYLLANNNNIFFYSWNRCWICYLQKVHYPRGWHEGETTLRPYIEQAFIPVYLATILNRNSVDQDILYLVNILESSFILGFFVRSLSWPILPVGLQAWPLVMCFSPTSIRSSWRTHASGCALWDTSSSSFLLSFSTSSCPQHLHEEDVYVEVMHQFTTDNHSFLKGAVLRSRKSCWFLLIHYMHI